MAQTNKRQIMDVASPGKSAANPTTRPVVVNNASNAKDQTIKGDNTMDSEDAQKPALSVHEKVIAPLSEGIKPEEEQSANDDAEQPVAATDNEETEAASPASEESSSESTDNEDADKDDKSSNESAVVDAVVDEASAAKQAKVDEEAATAHTQEIDKLVQDKKYFLPIKQAKQAKKRELYAALITVLLLAVMGGYLLADIGTINLGFEVPFHILGKKSVATNDTATAPTVTPAATPATPAPAPTATYSNSTYKFSFSYPKEWGDVTVADNTKSTTETGTRLLLTFSKQSTVTAGLMSKDWVNSSTDVKARCNEPGFPAYTEQKTALDNGLRVTYNGTNKQTYESLTGGLCDDLEMIGQVKFADTSQLRGFEVVYSAKATDKFDLAQRIADYKKDYNKYFPDTLRQQMITLTKTVVETK